MSASDRRAKLDREHPDLSIRRQCQMLNLARSGVYRPPPPAIPGSGPGTNDLEAMRRIDAPFTERPFFKRAADRQDAQRGRLADRSQACAALDAQDGDRSAGAEAEDDQASAIPSFSYETERFGEDIVFA